MSGGRFLLHALALVISACTGTANGPSPARTSSAITPADVRARIYMVADDSMGGRAAGTLGNVKMTSYIAREMTRLRLEPGGENGTWFQTVPLIRRSVDSASRMSVAGQPLTLFTDFALVRPGATVRFGSALPTGSYRTVYGGRAGDTTVTLSAAQVTGRIVVLDAPLGTNGQPTGVYSTPGAVAISRFPTAAGIAIAVIDLMTPTAAMGLRGSGNGLSGPAGHGRGLPLGILLSRGAAEKIVGRPLSAARPGTEGNTVDASVAFIEAPLDAPARNVIAIVRGSDPALRGQYVAVGAHSDHVNRAATAVDHDSLRAYNRVMRPYGAETRIVLPTTPTSAQWSQIRSIRDSLRRVRPPRRDSIFNGADDDGSGSVAMLEMAESLANGPRPKRSIVFVWHTAEESGLLGSAWFTENTTVPHDSIVAMLNMDMVGRGITADNPRGEIRYLQVIGSRRLSTDLGNIIDSVNTSRRAPFMLDYRPDATGHIQQRYCRSDHYMYARSGIPIAYMSRGYHQDYHMVTDEPQYISYDGVAGVAELMRDFAVAIADRRDRPRIDKPRPNPLAPCRQ